MNNVYQDQIGALPLSSFAPYLTNTAHSLWQEGIGNAVSNLVQSTEHRLSQWFWDGIGSLPKNYFSKDITNANYFDKSLWEGMFNERIEGLQEQLLSELQGQQSGNIQELRGAGFVRVDKLKEQMAAGLPQGKLSLEEQLIHLQGFVGKHTLSPQDYEVGLDTLKEAIPDNKYYTALIEQVRSSFRSELKTQQGLVEECLQGDLLRLFKESPEKSLTPAPLNKVLRYYKPLMKHKTYAKQKEWIEQCYNTQSLLPFPSVKKHVTESSPADVLSRVEGKQNSPTWGRGIRNWGKFLWENSGKLITFGLAAQVAAVQASNNRTQEDFVPEGNLTDGFSMMPMLDTNQTFPTVHTTLLGLDKDYVNNPKVELYTLAPQNKSDKERTTAEPGTKREATDAAKYANVPATTVSATTASTVLSDTASIQPSIVLDFGPHANEFLPAVYGINSRHDVLMDTKTGESVLQMTKKQIFEAYRYGNLKYTNG